LTARTPNIFVVGAGPVATCLAGALRLAGQPVLGLWDRTPARARMAGATAGVAAYSTAPPDLLLDADVVILAVKDDAIAQVARTLVASGLVNRHHILVHCSGVVSAEEALSAVAGEVGGIATMHPLRAIPDGRIAMRAMRGTVFGVEGDEAGRARAIALVNAMGGQVLELTSSRMAAYHAAAAMASNFVVVLLDMAAELLGQAGVEPASAVAALVPLARGALDNVAEHGLAGALTGPIKRGDAGTVGRHLEALADATEIASIYRQLGRRAADLAERAGVAAADLGEVRRRLAEASASASAASPRAQAAT
jgi:predicted short-subunit dehydrogenase-like oxidoreductase (DUF2520 family)